MCVSGDFNYNKTTWDSDGIGLCSGGPSVPDHNFITTLSDNSIHQVVSFPTFVNANGNCVNFLDLILSETEDRVFNVEARWPASQRRRRSVSFVDSVEYCSSQFTHTKL